MKTCDWKFISDFFSITFLNDVQFFAQLVFTKKKITKSFSFVDVCVFFRKNCYFFTVNFRSIKIFYSLNHFCISSYTIFFRVDFFSFVLFFGCWNFLFIIQVSANPHWFFSMFIDIERNEMKCFLFLLQIKIASILFVRWYISIYFLDTCLINIFLSFF